MEATVRRRWVLFAGFGARTGEEHLLRRVIRVVVGKGYSGGQEKDWVGRLEEHLKEFGTTRQG